MGCRCTHSGNDYVGQDSSFNWVTAPLVSGAGWILYCNLTKKRLYGSFFECYSWTGSYHGKLLGLQTIYTSTAVLESFFHISIATGKICCNNQGTLFKSKEYRHQIPTGALETDIKQALWNFKTMLKTSFVYE